MSCSLALTRERKYEMKSNFAMEAKKRSAPRRRLRGAFYLMRIFLLSSFLLDPDYQSHPFLNSPACSNPIASYMSQLVC